MGKQDPRDGLTSGGVTNLYREKSVDMTTLPSTRPATTIAEVEGRQCMNCGRPQDHRWHQGGERWGALTNGCSYAITQPQSLWDAVLRPALTEAGRAAGVDDLQTYGEALRWARS